MNFQDQPKSEKVARNPNNFNILKGGKVDPRSKLYQRSVAGREQLKDYLSRLSNSGMDESDVFMSGVKSLMNRGHGYVGAYLDSKNPGRRYEKNQAMAITDKVMTDEGIGEHPGARLTRPKVTDEEGNIDKEATKEARAKRKEANAGRGFGPQQAPGPSAKPVGQQRKEGKRESTGQPLEDSRREGVGDKDTGPVSEWQNTLESRLKGEATTQDVLSAFQKQYQSQIGGKKKPAKPQDEPSASTAVQPPAKETPEEQKSPETEEETKDTGRAQADDVTISSKFKELIEDNIKENLPSTDKNALESSIQEAIEILEDDYDVDPEAARAAIFRRFNNKFIGGRKIVFDPSSAPESSGRKESAPGPEQQKVAPEAKTPEPGQQEAAAPQSGGEEVQEPASAAPKKPSSGLNIPKQPTREGGGGFTPEIGKKATDTIRQAVSEGKSVEEVVKQFKQGNLFPRGLVTDTAQTNPLEGGGTPAPSGPPEELATPGTESPGQKTFLSKQKGKETQILPSFIQVPKPDQGVTDAKSYTQQLNRAGIPADKIEKAVKSAFPPKTKPRKKVVNSSEYQEFAQSVRSMMR